MHTMKYANDTVRRRRPAKLPEGMRICVMLPKALVSRVDARGNPRERSAIMRELLVDALDRADMQTAGACDPAQLDLGVA